MKFRLLLLVPLMIGCLQAASVDDLTFTLNDDGVSYSVTDCDPAATGEMIIPSTYNGLPVTEIGGAAFYNCSSLTSITIPNSVTSIGAWAFQSCSSLTSITIPNSVTSIGAWAFESCTSLTSITLPDSVTSIWDRAFYNCNSLTSITIPDGVALIGADAFSGTLLSFLKDTNSIEYLISASGNTAYLIDGSSSSGSVTLPSILFGASLKLISDTAFENSSGLTSITIPDSVSSIGWGAFLHCISLTSITLPDSVTLIEGDTFNDCTSLTSITIPDNVISIGEYAFNSCSSLTSITIPDSITSIGPQAFLNCSSLVSITIPDSVTWIGGNTFGGCDSLTSITLPIQLSGTDFFGDYSQPDQSVTYSFSYELIIEGLLADSNFVAKLAAAMIAAENSSGLATKEDLPIAIQQGVDQVIADPSAHNLATTAEVTQARTDGRQDVIENSADYDLYSESNIMEMNVSNPTLSMLNEFQQAQVEFTLETSTNLEDWTIEERIQRTVQATEEKFFVRISSGVPYVTPTVLVFNHPSYGEILTDQSGNVLYGFSIDSAGGDPLYSGSAWPLASHSTDPEPDADVTAALTRGTFSNTSGGPWLKINGRPVYTYVGDSEPNQASGHGLGSVWFTIKADGSLNQ